MTELDFHRFLVWAMFGTAVVTFGYLLRRPAPYGRHYAGSGWGPTVSSRVGWIVMESPAVLFFLFVFSQGQHAWGVVPLVFLVMWQSHYLNRTLIYPFRTRTERRMPLYVAGAGFFFNVLNAYVNARVVSHIGHYEVSWLTDPRFLVGMAGFVGEMSLNMHADNVVLTLRKQSRTGYVVPQDGAYPYISCPNYLGEILEWTGWAIATWSLAGLAFAVFTAANLAPPGPQQPQLVPGELPRLPGRPPRPHPRGVLRGRERRPAAVKMQSRRDADSGDGAPARERRSSDRHRPAQRGETAHS